MRYLHSHIGMLSNLEYLTDSLQQMRGLGTDVRGVDAIALARRLSEGKSLITGLPPGGIAKRHSEGALVHGALHLSLHQLVL